MGQYNHQPSSVVEKSVCITNDGSDRDLCKSFRTQKFSYISNHPKPLEPGRWEEVDPSSFMVRGHSYMENGVKVGAGSSIGHLVAVDVVCVDKPMLTGMSMHPTELIQ